MSYSAYISTSGPQGNQGDKGFKGDQGLSAYELFVADFEANNPGGTAPTYEEWYSRRSRRKRL